MREGQRVWLEHLHQICSNGLMVPGGSGLFDF